MSVNTGQYPTFRILGTRVHVVDIPAIIETMGRWIDTESQLCHHIVNTGMHGLMEGHRDPGFKTMLNAADLFAPDGILAVLIARIRGYSIDRQKTGPDLMWDFCKLNQKTGYKHYFYGETDETLELLSAKLTSAFPDLEIAGLYSPPFRPLTSEEDESVIASINQTAPDVLWVALGTPKQERWIFEHKSKLKVPVVVGVGASFKFATGSVTRPPPWLRKGGLEWMWRLLREPKRVWRRVFVDAPQFIGLVTLELTGIKKYV
jgi:N-acetylglucosaminyldiphosphoundecaprenol N-acetyl-beta-D-mannosaminyltransferase